jgi:hypothetical protein
MAINIYLTFYRRYSGNELKRLEKWYFLLCYGLPLALATALSVIKTTERGRIYGPALVGTQPLAEYQYETNSLLDLVLNYRTMAVSPLGVFLWSSVVGHKAEVFRSIRTDSLSHRVVSTVAFTIYVAVGSNIFKQHRSLQAAKNAMPVRSRVIKSVRSVTVDITHADSELLPVESATPYSVCIESQQSQSGSGIDAQINKNNAMWSYLRYSFLFFIAMVVTWVCILFPTQISASHLCVTSIWMDFC